MERWGLLQRSFGVNIDPVKFLLFNFDFLDAGFHFVCYGLG
jgi:hypothetical protein